MEGKFFTREIINKPSCPFCGMLLERPKELGTRMPTEMPLGVCACGAVYACDVTGHNLGAAMGEALVFACDGDWDLAWGLLPEDDYLEAQVANYDIDTHLIILGGVYGGRRIAGVLYFILLHADIREVTEEGVKRQQGKARKVSENGSASQKGKKSFTKREIETLVREFKVGPLLDLAGRDKRIIGHLQRLLYSADKLLRWKAADILGKVSAVIARNDPGAIKRLLQNLFTSVTDSAASSWGALDAIGEIIRNNHMHFAGFIPQLYPLTGDRALLAEVLRALGNIGEAMPDPIRKIKLHIIPLLRDADPEIRGHAVILLKTMGGREAKDELTKLLDDAAFIDLYKNGFLEKKAISQLAAGALKKI